MNFYLDPNNLQRDTENPRKAEKQRLVHVKPHKRQTPRFIKAIMLLLTSNHR